MKKLTVRKLAGLFLRGVTDQDFELGGGGKPVSVPDTDLDTVPTPAPEQAAVPAEPQSATPPASASASAPKPAVPPRLSLRQQVGAFQPVADFGRELVAAVAQFRTYERLRDCDTVDGAARRKKAIEAELSSGTTCHPIERVRQLQGELSRLNTVTNGTEFEVLRELRRRASMLADSSFRFIDLAIWTAELHLAKRREHQRGFFDAYGLPERETGICSEAEELIRELKNWLQAIDVEVKNSPELLNADDVAKRGAVPLYRSRPQPKAPGMQPITSALAALGLDVSPIRAALNRL
jgi:hypothetical protein